MTNNQEHDHIPCWYMLFSLNERTRCHHKARWKTDKATLAQSPYPSFIGAVRWCDEHRHQTDELMVAP